MIDAMTSSEIFCAINNRQWERVVELCDAAAILPNCTALEADELHAWSLDAREKLSVQETVHWSEKTWSEKLDELEKETIQDSCGDSNCRACMLADTVSKLVMTARKAMDIDFVTSSIEDVANKFSEAIRELREGKL